MPGQTMVHLSNSVAQTEAVAGELARTLRGGACIALHGELGSGKTRFVRGLVRALGGDVRAVSSPTFVLLNVYETPGFSVYHLDAYRVVGAEDFEAIGFSELLELGGLVVVEWAEKIPSLLPDTCVHVHIEHAGPRRRRITIEPQG